MTEFLERKILEKTEEPIKELLYTRECINRRDEKIKAELNKLKQDMWTNDSTYFLAIENILKMMEG